MGVSSKRRETIRPPLPAPTESMDEGGTTSGFDTDVATDFTARTDKSSYEIPEDGSPITIATQKVSSRKEASSLASHGRQKSQTSLLIEYFEGGKSGDKAGARPSVRVKVTPSSRKKSASGTSDAVQITGIGKDRKPSYTRRISLSGRNTEPTSGGIGGTEVSHSSGSNGSGRPPVEIEVLQHNGSDLSTQSRGLMYAPNESNVSSMPPESFVEGEYDRSRGFDRDEETPVPEADYLKAPIGARNRSTSRDRITQKVMEKLGQSGLKARKTSRTRSDGGLGYDREDGSYERRQRSSKSYQYDDEALSGEDGSVLSSNRKSYHSGSDVSRASKVSNNPRLLQIVEDTIKRTIMPEIDAIKAEQRTGRGQRSLEGGLERRVSKSSSTPNISSKPKVVLNRDGDDPGTVLSRGDSERRTRGPSYSERPSSRRSSGRRSSDRYEDEETVRQKSSRGSSHKTRDAELGAAAMAGGALTAAALKQHDSRDDMHRRRKKRSKSRGSRSRSASLNETPDNYDRREDIPPLPMASHINDSEITRESILSAETDRPSPRTAAEMRTPLREVSRGSLGDTKSTTPSKTSLSRSLGMSQNNRSIESPHSPGGLLSSKGRVAELAAAGLGGAAIAGVYERHVDADGYGSPPTTKRKIASPAQSVSSLKKHFEDESLVPDELRPRSAASRSSAGQQMSRTSLRSGASSPNTKLAHSRQASKDLNEHSEYITPLEQMPRAEFARDDAGTPGTPGTPSRGETVDDWYERQHRLNEKYRDSLDHEESNRDSIGRTTNRDSYQTNPYPQDEKRFTHLSDASSDQSMGQLEAEQDVQRLETNPHFIHSPHGAESAVASLMDPSNVSSNRLSDQSMTSPTKGGSYSERMTSHLREMTKDTPPMYEGSTMSQTMPSQDRWAAIRGVARDMSASTSKDDVSRGLGSPRQSPAKDMRGGTPSDEKPVFRASSVPMADDPLPEIGHFQDDDSRSDVMTNPSIIQGPLGGDVTGKDTWPYTPDPDQTDRNRISIESSDGHGSFSKNDGLLAAAAGGAAALAGAEAWKLKHAAVRDNDEKTRRITPEIGRDRDTRENIQSDPVSFPDEGYATDNYARSAGALTPKPEQQHYSKEDLGAYNEAMGRDSLDNGNEDPFVTSIDAKHARHISANSHGMASPLYDSATGRGKDHIQSKDIVALMDHLTVRDAQRNARDTEILVTLVRSAAEMRQSFDEIKRFIVEQDRMIMQNHDRGVEQTVQKVLSGPRPQPTSSPRTPRRQSEEDLQTKRRGVLRRALRGLTGGKSANDLSRVEDMLNQILDNVEDLKHQQDPQRPPPAARSYTNDSLDSYEKLRNVPDSGYEPEGQAGTSSTPSHSGHFPITPRGEKQQFHSGYDGRRGSENRVSTVMEGDEEDGDLEPHEAAVLDNQFENNERMLTPTQELVNGRRGYQPSTPRGANFNNTVPMNNSTPQSTEKQRQHKSISPSGYGSGFGNPKVSRWSKTTASSAAADLAGLDSPMNARAQRPPSDASGSNPSLHKYDNEQYAVHDDDRIRSTQSLARQEATDARSLRSQGSKITRTPSPLIPSETSSRALDDYDHGRGVSPVQVDPEYDEDEDEDEMEFDDPKYQAHRNSLLLQHPQPRPGQTGRHQNTLEFQAHAFPDETSRTNSDISQRSASDFDPALWGSAGTAGLAKHRLSQIEPLSPESLNNSPRTYGGSRLGRDDGPLVPQQKAAPAPKIRYEPDPEPDWEPQYSSSGFSRGGGMSSGNGGGSGGYYSSPYGSGHLLEPIEEVRYSLETDSGHISPEPQVQAAKAIDMRSTARKITGPRPMGSRSPQPKLIDTPNAAAVATGASPGTVRRKPIGGGGGGNNRYSRGDSIDSPTSETF